MEGNVTVTDSLLYKYSIRALLKRENLPIAIGMFSLFYDKMRSLILFAP
jgi:hypothetical protein